MNAYRSVPASVNPIVGFLVAIALLSVGAETHAQAADVVCDRCIDSTDVANRAVGSGKIKDKAIITRTLKGGAVTRPKLAKGVRDSIDQALGGIVLQQISASDGSGVAALLCPDNTLVGSASCICDDDDGSRNFGMLFACSVAGNGAVAGCFPEGVTFNPQLPVPLATVTATCVSAVQNDGEPIEPIFFIATAMGASKLDASGVEYEMAVSDARSAVAARTKRLISAAE
jgi:hypothetical protein